MGVTEHIDSPFFEQILERSVFPSLTHSLLITYFIDSKLVRRKRETPSRDWLSRFAPSNSCHPSYLRS